MHASWPQGGWQVPLARGGTLAIDRPLVMAILNATPDSFSDGGALALPTALDARVREVLAAGADVVDVGGESTRPGHAVVPAATELERILPVIQAVRAVDALVPISVDTRKAVVAQAALDAGADFVNDVSGLGDPAMGAVVAQAGCGVVLMRSRALERGWVGSCQGQWAELLAAATRAGIRPQATLLDPGLGFGSPPGADPQANLALLAASAHSGGRPVVVGASRKRALGALTGEPVPARRLGASVAAALLAVQAGAAIVRVHDVADTVAALRVLSTATTGLI
ncbi:MAG: dihydropteroate synthase [Thermoplasmatota archaeon]